MSIETYLQELADPGKPLVVSKLVNLSNMGPDEAPHFLSVWLEMAPQRRLQLIEELIDIAEDNVELNFDAAFFLALVDRDPDVRRLAIKGLWEYEGRDLIDPLLGLLRNDPDVAVRAEAALALGRFVLRAEFDTLRRADAERVERALHATFEDEAETSDVRGRALESIGARSEGWAQELVRRTCQSPDRRLRLSAIHAMGRSCDAAWLPALLPELESDDAEARFEAAAACGAIGDAGATPHLLPLLGDDDAEAQEAAISALGEIGGPKAKEALRDTLKDADERVREAVLAALAELEFAEDPLGFTVRG